jgi:hypothetical protein
MFIRGFLNLCSWGGCSCVFKLASGFIPTNHNQEAQKLYTRCTLYLTIQAFIPNKHQVSRVVKLLLLQLIENILKFCKHVIIWIVPWNRIWKYFKLKQMKGQWIENFTSNVIYEIGPVVELLLDIKTNVKNGILQKCFITHVFHKNIQMPCKHTFQCEQHI